MDRALWTCFTKAYFYYKTNKSISPLIIIISLTIPTTLNDITTYENDHHFYTYNSIANNLPLRGGHSNDAPLD